ncbi:unnamed protein product [Cylindrotheca closterium]|uniref:Bromo domain-containing protein n=1 Tax=Cylindrotheca closterium TaxID=2856 RepID=A0AAD2GC30_9STRA|nr:unnamed protein product [Cylindrotheca closterium]
MSAAKETGSPSANASSSTSEVPFLVTHWLANYNNNNNNNNISNGSSTANLSPEQKEAIVKIRKATAQIASAFTSLGAFGQSMPPPSLGSSFLMQSEAKHATYSDLQRKWAGLSPLHLEHLVQATITNNQFADNAVKGQINLLQASEESTTRTIAPGTGRTLQDAIAVDDTTQEEQKEGEEEDLSEISFLGRTSALHPPVLMALDHSATAGNELKTQDAGESSSSSSSTALQKVPVSSTYSSAQHVASDVMEQYLTVRETVRVNQLEVKRLQKALAKQEHTSKILTEQFQRITNDAEMEPADKIQQLEEIKKKREVPGRVITQLRRKLEEVQEILAKSNPELSKLEQQIHTKNSHRQRLLQNYRDPFYSSGKRGILGAVLGRQHGMVRTRAGTSSARTIFRGEFNPSHFENMRKALLSRRLSHAATINAHLTYPVYCLRFDRTGRYFITGADDYLIKVFYLGAGQSCIRKDPTDGSRQLKCNYGANLRGAVLVCSLRGHAGVINDIDISADNCLLATASVDGDVRVWGLRDGCPIAILRGHKGGANMVSWSTLTPYRLVSTGSDGYARQWDVRQACLKRYGRVVGKREEYRLRLNAREKEAEDTRRRSGNTFQIRSPALLPPLPVREGAPAPAPAPAVAPSPQAAARETNQRASPTGRVVVPPLPADVPPLPAAAAPQPVARENNQMASPPGRVVVPPLPANVPPLPGMGGNNAGQNNGDDDNTPGQFVANDLLDEGVKLLAKFKHGTTGEGATGPGTRARTAAVKVICVARSPVGGHFTTGCDDGICRVWPDSEDLRVKVVDQRKLKGMNNARENSAPRKERSNPVDQPLLQLIGHVSAITDLSYSHAGERILSASQKEGVIRIWSMQEKLLELESQSSGSNDTRIRHIVIKLTNPGSSGDSSGSSRRRPGQSSQRKSSRVSCDAAVWSHDDSKMLTSQSVLVKQNGTEVQPGSQYLFVWDSLTGQCLIGISGAHSMQCPVVIPHPADASLVCTAGADGEAKVWDLESGSCVFTHTNKIEFGPSVDPADRNKVAGYLDGYFSPDGTTVVLTDDDGRITILDCSTTMGRNTSSWVREQYFANDYYELKYDRTGYCIERGSERPPHLAPRGVRCTHSGTPYPDEINEAFGRSRLIGPMPLSEKLCRWRRNQIRGKSSSLEKQIVPASQSGFGVAIRRGIKEFDANSTIIIRGSCHVEVEKSDSVTQPIQSNERQTTSPSGNGSSNNNSQRSLSNNFQWRDYEDMLHDQGDDDIDSQDEEFEPTSRGRRLNDDGENSDDDDDIDEEMYDVEEENDSSRRNSRRRRSQGLVEERRSRRRNRRQDSQFVDIGSDDEEIAEFMSTNNTPSGDYLRDFNIAGHFWRLSGSRNVKRSWLKRFESDTSYKGLKTYTPQLGDSVVYIPRAHYESIKDFPSLSPPWQRWPDGAVWPIVRCRIRGIRYRFPYIDYYRRGSTSCTSIVAILTLEVTGIPELSTDREFPWPKPSFVQPTRKNVFELSLFEIEQSEFLLPENQYLKRMLSLETAVRQNAMDFSGLEVTVCYAENGDDAEFGTYPAKIDELEEEEDFAHASLRGSGFGTLNLTCQGFTSQFSPWEIEAANTEIDRPSLSDEEKKLVMDNLNEQLKKNEVREYFSRRVNQVRYSDYWSMVEVEMSLFFIKRRLEANYYGSKLSVVGDVRLIRDNCIKYNSMENELSGIACEMCDEFESKVLSETERVQLITEDEFNNLVNSSQASETSVRLRARDSRRPSSLETLPQPGLSSQRRLLQNEGDAFRPRRSSRSLDTNPGTEVLGRMTRRRGGPLPSYNEDADNDDDFDRPEEEESGRRSSSRRSRGGDNDHVSPTRTQRAKRVRYNVGDAGEESDEDEYNSPEDESSEEADDDALSEDDLDDVQARRSNGRNSGRSSTRIRINQRSNSRSSSPKRPMRSRRNNSASVYQDVDSDIDMEEEVEAPVKSRRPSRNNKASVYQDVDSEEGESDEEEVVAPARSRRSGRNNRASKPKDVDSDEDASHEEEPETPTRSRRSRANKTSVYEEVDSDVDFEEDEENNDDDSEDFEADYAKGKKKGSRGTRSKYFEDSGSDSEEEPSRTSRKRSGGATSTKSIKRRRRSSENKTQELPKLSDWPEIPIKDISSVARGIIGKLENLDTDDTFAIPVLESYPDLANDYLTIVDVPMDLRTIREERVPLYESIKELQKDLILMFKNCCDFNETGTDLWNYAATMWTELNQIFVDTCGSLNVLLPRRWTP